MKLRAFEMEEKNPFSIDDYLKKLKESSSLLSMKTVQPSKIKVGRCRTETKRGKDPNKFKNLIETVMTFKDESIAQIKLDIRNQNGKRILEMRDSKIEFLKNINAKNILGSNPHQKERQHIRKVMSQVFRERIDEIKVLRTGLKRKDEKKLMKPQFFNTRTHPINFQHKMEIMRGTQKEIMRTHFEDDDEGPLEFAVPLKNIVYDELAKAVTFETSNLNKKEDLSRRKAVKRSLFGSLEGNTGTLSDNSSTGFNPQRFERFSTTLGRIYRKYNKEGKSKGKISIF